MLGSRFFVFERLPNPGPGPALCPPDMTNNFSFIKILGLCINVQLHVSEAKKVPCAGKKMFHYITRLLKDVNRLLQSRLRIVAELFPCVNEAAQRIDGC